MGLKMKLPLYALLLIVWALSASSFAAYKFFQEREIDASIKSIGTVKYKDTEMRAWKTGGCYVYGVHYVIDGTSQPPRFFSACGR